MRDFSSDFKLRYENSMVDVIDMLLTDQFPFGLVLAINDNWSPALPDVEKKKNATLLIIKEDSLEDSYYDEDEGRIFLSVGFAGERYTTWLDPRHILAIMQADMKAPIMVKPFESDVVHIDEEKAKVVMSPDWLYKEVSGEGEAALLSAQAMVKNNPELFEA